MKNLYIIGAGGLGREIAWMVERINKFRPQWQIKGFIVDDSSIIGTTINGYPVLGDTSFLSDVKKGYVICAIGKANVRKIVIERITNPMLKYATLIDPSAIIADSASIGEGSIISMNTIITTNTIVCSHVLVNYGTTVGHDTTIHDYTTLYPGCNISGNVEIGSVTEIGTGSQIIQGKTVASNIIVGAGSVVINDITEKGTYVGVPVRKVK